MIEETVVISNYQYARFVNSAIESCLIQDPPCKIIVVDDASTDNSWQVITNYVSQGVKAVRLKVNSRGNARGKNVGICLSDTKYITCLDADDMLLPGSIQKRLPFPPDVDFVHGWARHSRNSNHYKVLLKDPALEKPFRFTKKALKLMDQKEERWSFAIEASTVLARRSLYERFGLYDEEMRWTIDREMWWRWLSHGAKKLVKEEYVSIYRRHAGQLTLDRSRKNPKKCAKMLGQRQKLRETITPENTLLMTHYDYQQFIGDMEG